MKPLKCYKMGANIVSSQIWRPPEKKPLKPSEYVGHHLKTLDTSSLLIKKT